MEWNGIGNCYAKILDAKELRDFSFVCGTVSILGAFIN